MNREEHTFSEKKVTYYFGADFSYLEQLVDKVNTILITDENVFRLHEEKFNSWKVIVIKAGEAHKQQATVDTIIEQLIELEADRKTFLVGIGGGVVTDIAGYAASVYMRGLRFGFVPTTILAMVDAAIGGKNGVDVGVYKNLVGLTRQPEFLLFDYTLLKSLPLDQWVNGFAEVIKHACIKDAALFEILELGSLEMFKTDPVKLCALIERNVSIKTELVLNDEFERGDRKLLNFGHSFGHAIENLYQLPHGHAVSIGMAIAATISEEINNLPEVDKERLMRLLCKYSLPIKINFDKVKVQRMLKMDKKKVNDGISFVLLNKIGEAVIETMTFTRLEDLINQNY